LLAFTTSLVQVHLNCSDSAFEGALLDFGAAQNDQSRCLLLLREDNSASGRSRACHCAAFDATLRRIPSIRSVQREYSPKRAKRRRMTPDASKHLWPPTRKVCSAGKMPLLLLKQPGLRSLFDSTVGTQRETHRAKLQSLAQHPKKIESGHYCYLEASTELRVW
jgi:hypothetical protein